MYYYNKTYAPPAPKLEATITTPIPNWTEKAVKIKGKLDTGADISVIPEKVVEQLRLCPADIIETSNYDRKTLLKLTYRATIAIANYKFQALEVVSANRDEMLIGRDILNQWLLILNGPKQTFQIK